MITKQEYQTAKSIVEEYESQYTLYSVVKVRMDNFMVHLDTRKHTLKFECYPVTDWEKLSTGEKGISYTDKENEPDFRDEFEKGKCLKKLEGSFSWRGVWEGRLYFTDDEYWGEEISELSRLYNDKIVPWCKGFIKNREPKYHYYPESTKKPIIIEIENIKPTK